MLKRIQRKRTKGWRLPENARCVTRPGKFGNPFLTARAFREWIETGDVDRDSWLADRYPKTELPARRVWIICNLWKLKGFDLACYCQPIADCHGDYLLDLANLQGRFEERCVFQIDDDSYTHTVSANGPIEAMRLWLGGESMEEYLNDCRPRVAMLPGNQRLCVVSIDEPGQPEETKTCREWAAEVNGLISTTCY